MDKKLIEGALQRAQNPRNYDNIEIKDMVWEMLYKTQKLVNLIFEKHNLTIEDISYDRWFAALFDEVGELNHALKSEWCWWRNDNPTPDRLELAEELADIWHFIFMGMLWSVHWYDLEPDWLSWWMEALVEDLKFAYVESEWNFPPEVSKQFEPACLDAEQMAIMFFLRFDSRQYRWGRVLIRFGDACDMNIREVYEVFKVKNAENIRRQLEGY